MVAMEAGIMIGSVMMFGYVYLTFLKKMVRDSEFNIEKEEARKQKKAKKADQNRQKVEWRNKNGIQCASYEEGQWNEFVKTFKTEKREIDRDW